MPDHRMVRPTRSPTQDAFSTILADLVGLDERTAALAAPFLTVVGGSRERALLEPWALRVLEARSRSKQEPCPVVGKGVEFHADHFSKQYMR
jgi:hypothetical protein